MSRLRTLLLVALACVLLAACQAAPTVTPIIQIITATPANTATPIIQVVTATPSEEEQAQAIAGTTLTVVGPEGEITLTLDELRQLPALEGFGGMKSSTGRITPPAYFTGVSLDTLASLVGPFDASMAINVVAKDGYAMTFSYDQLTQGSFITFDPATGDEVQRDERLQVAVVYDREGQALSEEEDGTLRLAILGPEKNQVTDGHWAVKWVRQVVLKEASSEWTLHLEGALVEDMDRNTFESGAAPNCHLAQWADAEGHVWSGIPLYYLMGRVDDDNRHESGAFAIEQAELGYPVDIVSADGFRATLNSADLIHNQLVILAYLVDDEPLPEDSWPLRLVGAGLSNKEMVASVAQIQLHLGETIEPEEEDTPTPAPQDEPASEVPAPDMVAGVLHVYGRVGIPTAFTPAHLEQIGTVDITAEHPKKGPGDYSGTLLSELLAQVEPEEGVSRVIFTSSDGYAVEVPWADLQACEQCLVSVTDDQFRLVMPRMESNFWAKDVLLIEVK